MPRPDSNQLIQELRELGVPVKMLTGDALPIAQQIAQDVGLVGSVTRMADLEAQLKQDPAQAAAIAEQSDGFAEIYPEGKYRVVQSLQARGHVVGMTGDGVNDAPALKQAEVGIAVSNATDVAKGAASVVLTGEGLASIVDLVTNGREVYQRIATWIINKISRTILKSAFVVGAFLLTGKYVISSLAMILMIFMTDFVKISLATDNVRGSKKPETWDVGGLVRVAAILGVLMVVESFGMLYIGLRYFGLGANELALHTFSFTILLYFALFSILVVRERRHFWESRPSNTLLVALTLDGIVAAAIATFGLAGMQPIPFAQTLFVIAYAFVFSLVVNDWCKFELVKRAGMSW
jgi:magnesium-transporting ATPase (P-type)